MEEPETIEPEYEEFKKEYEIKVEDVEYKLDDFNSSSNYYCIFVIYDTSNNAYYSKLIYMR